MPIPYGRQTVNEDDIDAVVEVLRSPMLTQGPRVREFEEALAEACDVLYAVAFSSGTAALHGAAFAADLGPGNELVTSAMTFAASANCGAYVGAIPRFADIDPKTFNVSAETVTEARTRSTKAVVPVHFAGLPLRSRRSVKRLVTTSSSSRTPLTRSALRLMDRRSDPVCTRR